MPCTYCSPLHWHATTPGPGEAALADQEEFAQTEMQKVDAQLFWV